MKLIYFMFLFAFLPLVCNAQWVQIGQDIDGEAQFDDSGYSVSLSSDGSIVAIGAPINDVNLTRRGHVRVFENNEGYWTQIGQDIDGVDEYDWSGYSVSLSSNGNVVAIGAAFSNIGGQSTGNVRIYEYSGGAWTQVGQVIIGSIYGNAGWAVSLSSDGSIVAIGCPEKGNPNTIDGRGRVRVYENSGGNWIQIGQDIVGQSAFDHTGKAISLSSDGSIVAIGEDRHNGGGSYSGQVRVYENTGGNWIQIGQDIIGEAPYDYSGSAVSLNSEGSIIAIGARWNDGANGTNSGHVRIYENNNGTWSQIGQDIDGESEDNWMGESVSLNSDGSIVAIGAERNNNGNGFSAGHARIYQNTGGNWIQIGQDIDGESAIDYSATSISLSSNGAIVAIGAPENDGNNNSSGHVRIFKNSVLGIDDFVHTKLSIYPNPVGNKLRIVNKDTPLDNLIIYSIDGQVVLEIPGSHEIDVSGLPSGIYFIQITFENQIHTKKFIKK